MDVEVWHERGCGRIGEITTGIRITMALGEGWWHHEDCHCLLAGDTSDGRDRLLSIQAWTGPAMLRRESPLYRHVEHPRFAQDDAREQQQRLDGWLSAIMAVPDRSTRAAVADSLTAHLLRYGEVP